MKIRMCRTVRNGDALPPWYYGYAYSEDFDHYYVFYPMPLHWFVRVGKMLQRAWVQVQIHGVETDRIVRIRMENEAYRGGFKHGFDQGMIEAYRMMRSRLKI